MTLIEILVLALVFCLAAGAAWVVSRQVADGATVSRRLRGEAAGAAEDAGRAPSNLLRETEVRGRAAGLFRWISGVTSLKDEKERGEITGLLAQAGIDHPAAPVWYVIVRLVAAIVLPLGFIGFGPIILPNNGPLVTVFWALMLSACGLILPKLVLERVAATRRADLTNAFPDALDLMVICVEAGLGLEAAFVRVGTESRESHPRLAREFLMVSHELRAGRTRADALRNLGERTYVPEIQAFSTLLIQTDQLGTSIAQALRVYSAEMREARYLRAEEKAARIPVLLTIPLVVCMLPVIVVALLLPGIIGIVRDMLPAMTGGGG